MSYSSYNDETPLDLNSVRYKEGLTTVDEMNAKLDEIKTVIKDFENKKELSVTNAGIGKEGMTIADSINMNEELQGNSKYNKYILSNDKQRKNMVDARINDNKLLKDSNNQTYVLGTIAAASLVVLLIHM
jgi:endo-1,4-beta-mannosidase